jgi:hypothetical protein
VRVDENSHTKATIKVMIMKYPVLRLPISLPAENRKAARNTNTYGRKAIVLIKRLKNSIADP